MQEEVGRPHLDSVFYDDGTLQDSGVKQASLHIMDENGTNSIDINPWVSNNDFDGIQRLSDNKTCLLPAIPFVNFNDNQIQLPKPVVSELKMKDALFDGVNMPNQERKGRKRRRSEYEKTNVQHEYDIFAEHDKKRSRVIENKKSDKKEYVQQKKMRKRIKFLEKFRKEHDGCLPSLRGIMKFSSCGYKKAKETVVVFAERHDMTVQDVELIMIIRNK